MRRSLGIAVAALHALVAVGAAAVPFYGILDALLTSAATPHGVPLFSAAGAVRWAYLLMHTATVVGVAIAVALVLGVPTGLLLARTDVRLKSAIRAALLLAAGLPIFVAAVFILALVPAVHLSQSDLLCGLLYGLIFTPLATLLLDATLRGGHSVLEEQARIDGSPRQVVWHVILPLARGGIAAVAVLLIVLVATDTLISDLLAVRTFAEEVYLEFMLDPARVGPILTAIPLMLVLTLAAWSVARLRSRDLRSEPASERVPVTMSLGRWRAPATIAVASLIIAIGVLPIAAVLRQAMPPSEFARAAGAATRSVLTSLGIGAAAAGVLAAVAPGLAWATLRRRTLGTALAIMLIAVLSTPAPVVGASLVRLFNRPGWLGAVYDSPAIVALGYIVRFLPIAVLVMWPTVARIARELADAARVDGCDGLALLRHIVWPLAARTIALTLLVALILSFGEVNIAKLVTPPGWETAADQAFQLLHFGVYRDLAVLALLSTAATVILWTPLAALLGRRARVMEAVAR